MKNPTTLIWAICCGSVLLPILLAVVSYVILYSLARKRPTLIYQGPDKESVNPSKKWTLEIQDHEPLAKAERND
jgi:hypothetical protein